MHLGLPKYFLMAPRAGLDPPTYGNLGAFSGVENGSFDARGSQEFLGGNGTNGTLNTHYMKEF